MGISYTGPIEGAELQNWTGDAIGAQNVYRPPERASMDQKLVAAREWLGDRYLCAHPIERRKRR